MIVPARYHFSITPYEPSSALLAMRADMATAEQELLSGGLSQSEIDDQNDAIARLRVAIPEEITRLASLATSHDLPASSVAARLKQDDPTYLSAIVPMSEAVSSLLAGVADAVMQVDISVGAVRMPLVVADYETMRLDLGPESGSYTLTGHRSQSFGGGDVSVVGTVNTVSILEDGRHTLSVARPLLGVTPGMTLTYDGDIRFVVYEMAINIDAMSASVQYTEGESVTGAPVLEDGGSDVSIQCLELVELPFSGDRSWAYTCALVGVVDSLTIRDDFVTYYRWFGLTVDPGQSVRAVLQTENEDARLHIYEGRPGSLGTLLSYAVPGDVLDITGISAAGGPVSVRAETRRGTPAGFRISLS